MQIFYKARVEDNGEELKRDDRRVRVRVLGIHPFENEIDFPNVPEACLPWARQAQSLEYNSSKSSYQVPSVGQWVWVFFEDEGFQQPVYFAYVCADSDGDPDFKPGKNKVTKENLNNDTKIISNDYNQSTTNGNGLLLSTNDNMAVLTNSRVAEFLQKDNIEFYVGGDKDQSSQSMVYGNHLLDCFQSTLKTIEESFKGLRKEFGKIDVDGSIGSSIPDIISVGGNINIGAIKDSLKSANAAIEKANNEKGSDENQIAQIDANSLTKNIPTNIDMDIDLSDTKETILQALASTGMEKTVVGGAWIGEPFYTAKISLAFLQVYKAIDTLYNMILYLKNRDDVKEVADKWRDTLNKEIEGDDNRYKGISRVRDNLKDTLNNNALFKPKNEDFIQMINEELRDGLTEAELKSMDLNVIKNIMLKPDKIKYIVIHCSEGSYGDAKSINWFHMVKRGWSKIGYHYVILNGLKDFDEYKKWIDDGRNMTELESKSGVIETGRVIDKDGNVEMGAQVEQFNNCSIGISLIGGFCEKNNELDVDFTNKQITEAVGLVKGLMKKYNVPVENVKGHYEMIEMGIKENIYKEKPVMKDCPNFKISKNTLLHGRGMDGFRDLLKEK